MSEIIKLRKAIEEIIKQKTEPEGEHLSVDFIVYEFLKKHLGIDIDEIRDKWWYA